MFAGLCTVFCSLVFLLSTQSAPVPVSDEPTCPSYGFYSRQRHDGNRSTGLHELPYQRPAVQCRKFPSPEVEASILRLKGKIQDPDLFRLFENAYPNTLDTAILWTGFAYEKGSETKYTDEDLAFVITGDM